MSGNIQNGLRFLKLIRNLLRNGADALGVVLITAVQSTGFENDILISYLIIVSLYHLHCSSPQQRGAQGGRCINLGWIRLLVVPAWQEMSVMTRLGGRCVRPEAGFSNPGFHCGLPDVVTSGMHRCHSSPSPCARFLALMPHRWSLKKACLPIEPE